MSPALASCYFGPIITLEADMAPIISSSNKAPWNGPLKLETSTNIYVFSLDEDQESLRYEWVLSDDGRVENAKTVALGASQISLDPDLRLDNQRLTFTVIDSEQQVDSIFWDLEVLR